MRSYFKVFYKQNPAGDNFYVNLSDVPDKNPDAILAFEQVKKAQFVTNLNVVANDYVTFWGLGPDSVPQWLYDNGGSAFQLNSIFKLNFGPWAPGIFFPFVLYPPQDREN